MGGGVGAQLALVAGGGEQLAVAGDHGADRHVAVALGLARPLDRQRHHPLVDGVCSFAAACIREYVGLQLRRRAGVSGELARMQGFASADHR